MKKIIIIAAVILINSPALFAQWKAGKKDTTRHATFYSSITDTKNTSLSSKERMKMEVVKLAPVSMGVDATNNYPDVCPSCFALSKLSPKEKMKAQVVGIYKCSQYYGNAGTVKCSLCGMRMIPKKV